MKRAFAARLAFAFAILGARALAQDVAAADALFRDAQTAMGNGDYASACAKFHESNRLDRTVGTTMNLALCEAKRGRVATAWALYQAAIELMQPGDDRLAEAKGKHGELDARLPRLQIEPTHGTPRGVEISLDGERFAAAVLGVALPVNPGDHVVAVSANGHAERRYEFTIDEGETKQLRVEPGERQRPVQRAPVVAKPRASAKVERTAADPGGAGDPGPALGIVSIAIGGVALGAVGYIEWRLADECDANKRCPATANAETWQTVDQVLFGVGVLGVGLGAYLLIDGGGGPSESATLVRALPLGPLGSGAGLSATRRF